MANIKPKHIKEAQGTLRKCREVDSPATTEPIEVPAVPDEVPEEGRGYFTHACEVLFSLGVLTAAYVPDISRAAMTYAFFIRAQRELEESGTVQMTKTGYTAISANWTVYKDSLKYLTEFESRYGLSLVSAQRLSVPDKPKKDDDFD